MIATPPEQQRVKVGFVRDAVERATGSPASVEWVEAEHEFHYRRRARLAWKGNKLGYRQRRSHTIVDAAECLVLAPQLQHALSLVRASLCSHLSGEGELLLARSHGDDVVIALKADAEQSPELYGACESLANGPHIAGVALQAAGASRPAAWGDARERLAAYDGTMLDGVVAGFSQANDAVNMALVRTVLELVKTDPNKKLLELHAGVGNLTVALADRASVVAVERDESAAEACRENLRARALTAKVVVGDAEDPPRGGFDVAVLDPPRQGAEGAIRALTKRRIPCLIYVSCETATLSRDLAIAVAAGYSVDRAFALDMFPNTAHVESIVRLVCS